MRTFIAIPINSNKKIKDLQQELIETKTSLTIAKNLHLTLKFLGEITSEQIKEIKQKLNQITNNFKPFTIDLEKTGAFPNEDFIRVIWIGTSDPKQKIIDLQRQILENLQNIRKEEHKAIIHLTIARIKTRKNKEKIQKFLQKHKNEHFGKEEIKKIQLIESKRTQEETKYRVIKEYTLTKNI